MLNTSTLSMNDQGKSFWELVYGSDVRSSAHRTWSTAASQPISATSLVNFSY